MVSEAETAPSPWTGGKARRGRGRDFPVKREAVLNAAAALMGRKGYDGMSLAELADTLNITKPTLYHYVGNKEALFVEVVARSQEMMIAFLGEIAGREASGYEKLRAMMLGYAVRVNSDPGTQLLFSNSDAIGPQTRRDIASRARQANGLILAAIAQGQDDGTLAIAHPTLALNALFGSLNWSTHWFRPDGPLDLEGVAALQVDLLLDGVRA